MSNSDSAGKTSGRFCIAMFGAGNGKWQENPGEDKVTMMPRPGR